MRRVTFTVRVSNKEQTTHKGTFHGWGAEGTWAESRDLGESVGTQTMAIIEDDEGAVQMVLPERVKFDEPYIVTMNKKG